MAHKYDLPKAERITRWKAPTGRWVEYGNTCRVEGMRGKFKFLAYVIPVKGSPYVDAKDSRGLIRAVDPAKVYAVSTKKV